MDSTISSGSFFGKANFSNLDSSKSPQADNISYSSDPYDYIENLSLDQQMTIAERKLKIKKPRVIYFYVGIDRYDKENDNTNPINRLNYACTDISALKDCFSRNEEDIVFYLHNDNALQQNILNVLKFIAKNSTKEDLFTWAMSAHGYFDPEESDQMYIIPHDGNLNDVGKDDPSTLISTKQLLEIFCGKKNDEGKNRPLKARSIFLFDMCYSGASIGKDPQKDMAEGAKVVHSGASASSVTGPRRHLGNFMDTVYIQTATTGYERAFEMREIESGALFAAIIIGLGPAGRLGLAESNNDGDIRCVGELDRFVKVAVKRLEYIISITRYGYSFIVPPEGSYDLKIASGEKIDKIFTEEEKSIITKQLRADGFASGQVVTPFNRMKKRYSQYELECAKARCAQIGHYIELNEIEIKDFWLISLIIDKYSEKDKNWEFVKAFPENENGKRFEITKAISEAEKSGFIIQTPSFTDNYPSMEDPDAADEIIKSLFNIHGRQKRADRGERPTNIKPNKP